ncbi:3-deoxy-manno-octulosonate cytidylyltransferase [Porphyromonas pogonae]|uniref:3-deoxy-manno-octulosonate cytidylyltransferase n=1 Tax=Porphyromonas pogonae TaxID=867595 RepID=UPI002E7A9E51|nr:3-deoxy-manno-octulosonate cytidylyltransferase [Porphyromonas pogonae]
MSNRVIAIIPARYASSRFPGKPLADMLGKPMIRRVVEQAKKVVHRVVVATDDQRIYDTVSNFGGEVVMTSPNHRSGTDRCAEAYQIMNKGEEIVLNLQGDEPFIHLQQISDLVAAFDTAEVQIATLAEAYCPDVPDMTLQNPNQVKVVMDIRNNALYFSRSVIPHFRDCTANMASLHTYYKHIGLYAFRSDVLKEITSLPRGILEQAESLEQLRWLENGYKIRIIKTSESTIGIDTPEDLERAVALLKTLDLQK